MGSIENLKPYEEYKDSGVEWLGEIPNQWEMRKLSTLGALVTGNTPSTTDPSNFDGIIPFFGPADLVGMHAKVSKKTISKKGAEIARMLPAGTVLITCIGTLGKSSILVKESCSNQQINSIIPSFDIISSEFLYYSTATITSFMVRIGTNTLLPIVNKTTFGAIRIPLPPLQTQHRIVEFLDAETVRIDNLVAEMEAMITLLRENRKILISETVTRGIAGEHTEFKDSGVEWLGEIPVGWELQKISRIAKFFTGGTPPTEQREFFNGEESWASIADLKDGILRDTHKKLSQKGVEKARITLSPAGSLLYSFKLSVGKVAITTFPTYTNEAIATFVPSQKILTKYAFYCYPVFLVKNAKKNIYDADLLNADLINQARLPLPSVEEQERIIAYLDLGTAKIDNLILEAINIITLLKEERKVLISDVVSGNLEVI